jgi:hypothetical protein
MKAGLYKNLVGVVAVALVVALPIAAAATTAPISNLIVRPQGDFVELTVIGGGRTLCDNFTEPAGNGRPFRIVLDFCDADHAMGQQTFDGLPLTQIKRIRTSQFATNPQRIVRVVLDMREEVTYSTRNEESALVVRFVDPNRQFAAWEANPNAKGSTPANTRPTLAVNTPTTPKTAAKKESKPKVVAKPAPVMAQTPPTVTAPPKTKTHDVSRNENTYTPLVASERTETQPLSDYASPKPQTPVVVATYPMPAKTETNPAAAKSAQHVSATPATTAEPMVKKVTENAKQSPVSDEKPVFAKTEKTSNPVTITTAPSTPAMTSNATKAEFAANRKPFVVPQVPLVFAPEYLDGTKPMMEETPAPARDFAVSKESLIPAGPPQPSPAEKALAESEAAQAMWASTTSPNPDGKSVSPSSTPAHAEPVDDTEVQPTGTLLDRLKTKFFGNHIAPRPYTTIEGEIPGADSYGPPTPSNDLDREALLERIRQTEQRVAAGGSGSQDMGDEGGAGGVPTRAILHYDDMGRRDPFAPLVTGMRSGFVTDQLPDVETLRLVGVLHDDVEALALLENVEGYSYIMRTGDRVQNGSLVSIQGNRALFRVEDYGWSHTVALQLTPRGADPSKALGLAPRKYPKHEEEQSNSTDNKGSDGE